MHRSRSIRVFAVARPEPVADQEAIGHIVKDRVARIEVDAAQLRLVDQRDDLDGGGFCWLRCVMR